MDAGTQGERINPWGVELFTNDADGRAEQRRAAVRLRHVDRPDLDRETARDTRSTAPPVSSRSPCGSCCSSPAIIFVFLLLFADSGERALSQALLMGRRRRARRLLLLLKFLDNPFHDGVGGRATGGDGTTLALVEQMAEATGTTLTIPATPTADPPEASGLGSCAGGRRLRGAARSDVLTERAEHASAADPSHGRFGGIRSHGARTGHSSTEAEGGRSRTVGHARAPVRAR